ncbi:MAG: hypothetical protein WA019_01265 [Candidatus Moraniibacteriota bacterium]
MDEVTEEKLPDTLLYKLYELEKKSNSALGLSDEEKIEKINQIKAEYDKEIAKLEDERDAVIKEAVALLEAEKIKEIKKEL